MQTKHCDSPMKDKNTTNLKSTLSESIQRCMKKLVGVSPWKFFWLIILFSNYFSRWPQWLRSCFLFQRSCREKVKARFVIFIIQIWNRLLQCRNMEASFLRSLLLDLVFLSASSKTTMSSAGWNSYLLWQVSLKILISLLIIRFYLV